MIALLLCAAAAAAPDARAAAELVPASARAALLLDGRDGAGGLRDFLTAAGAWAPLLEPRSLGRELHRSVGVDLLQADPPFLSAGPRALVVSNETWGLSAPVTDAKAARRALEAWLAEDGPVRPTRPSPLKGPLVSANRAGMIAPVAAGLRFLTASGKHAATLVSELAHVGPRRADTAPLSRDAALGPSLQRPLGRAALWLRGEGPLHGALLSLDASAHGLVARGLAISATSAALLDGAAPGPCATSALGSLRAAPGPAGRTLAALGARQYLGQLPGGAQRDAIDKLLQRALAGTTQGALCIDSIDVHALGDAAESLRAIHFSSAARAPDFKAAADAAGPALISKSLCLRVKESVVRLDAPCGPPLELADAAVGEPSLLGQVDFAAIDRVLSRMSPLDALNGSVAAGAIAAHLLWSDLFRHSGPLEVTGKPAGTSADLELKLPLH